jgi:hypothetical protein
MLLVLPTWRLGRLALLYTKNSPLFPATCFFYFCAQNSDEAILSSKAYISQVGMNRRGTIFPGQGSEYYTFVRKRRASEELPTSTPPTDTPPTGHSRRRVGPLLPVNIHLTQGVGLTDVYIKENPWSYYKRLFNENQAGPATIATKIDATHRVAAIKIRTFRHDHGGVTRYSHPNIVSLLEVFLHNGHIFFVYEPMTIPLSAFLEIPYEDLIAPEIAAVAKEVSLLLMIYYCLLIWKVLQGLQYLHQTMNIVHGALCMENILLHIEKGVRLGKMVWHMHKRRSDGYSKYW